MSTSRLKRSGAQSDSWLCTSSGIDWLSCSAPRCDGLEPLWLRGGELLREAQAAGNQLKAWKLRNLSGHIAGSVVRALSPTHIYVQVSSTDAANHAAELIPLAQNVSRLDLQLTAGWHGAAPRSLADEAYQAVELHKRGGRPLDRTLLSSRSGGSTCYCGSRRSDVFGRVYDKGVESGTGEAGTMWRWELELKRDVAELTARELALAESLTAIVAEIVHGKFTDWGVPVPPGPSLPLHMKPPKPRNDAARILEWLSRAVRPSVRFLLAAVGPEATYSALGLPWPPTTDSSS